MLFAPLLAPMLGAGLGGFFSSALGSGLLTGALTALESKDMNQGLMAGLMGGGIGGLLNGAGGMAGAGAANAAGGAGGAMAGVPGMDLTGAGANAASSAMSGVPGMDLTGAAQQTMLAPQNAATSAMSGVRPSVFDGGSFMDNLSGTYNDVTKAAQTPGWMEKAIKGPGMMAGLGWLGLTSAQEKAAAEAERNKKSGNERPSMYNTYGYRSAFAQGGLAQLDPGTMAGRYLRGKTDGVADQVPAMINGQRPATLSDGEFVVDAHTVSALGNGNSEAGAAQLKKMQQRVRTAKYGKAGMPKKINPSKMLPA